MTGQEKINTIVEKIEAGYTVTFSTVYRVIPVNLKTLNSFKKAGFELFKTDEAGHILMMSGKRYDIMDGCEITFA